MATSCMKALLKSKNNNENRALCTQQELLSSLDPPPFFFLLCVIFPNPNTIAKGERLQDCTKTFRVLLEFTAMCPKGL